MTGWLRGRDGGDTRTVADTAACQLGRGGGGGGGLRLLVFYVIICVITYKAIKQTSLPVSSCLVLLDVPVAVFLPSNSV